MSDIKCPKCGDEQEVNHDDGYGYEEDETYEQECVSCGYEIKFTTAICYVYEVFCADKRDHVLFRPLDNKPDFWLCENCDYSELQKGSEL